MRIGIDACCWSNKRGFGRFTRDLVTALVEVDERNEYVLVADQKTAGESKFPKGVEIATVETAMSPTEAASWAGRRSLRDVWVLSRLAARTKVDLFFFPAVYSYFPVLGGVKVVVTIHDMIADHRPDLVFASKKTKLFWKVKQNVAVRQADLVLTVSGYSRRQIIDFFDLPESRVKTISEAPNPIFTVRDQDRVFNDTLKRYGLIPGRRFLLYVGGLSPHKNLTGLVDAFLHLIGDGTLGDLMLVLVGDYEGDSFYSNYCLLKSHIEELGLDRRVVFTGHIPDEDLVCIYNAATVLVFPSLDEGFGLPAVEAMACGLPVAASDRGSLPEILGEAGRYFDPLSIQAMCEVLRTVVRDRVLRGRMRESGLCRAKDFVWEVIAKKAIRIFVELVENQSSHG